MNCPQCGTIWSDQAALEYERGEAAVLNVCNCGFVIAQPVQQPMTIVERIADPNAILVERAECAAAICKFCRARVPFEDDFREHHVFNDDLRPCEASAIWARNLSS